MILTGPDAHSRGDREEQPGPARDRVVHRRDAPPPATPSAEPFHLDPQHELVARLHEATEAHLLDAAEERERAGITLVGQDRDPTGLRERLELEHPGNDGVPREMTGEKILVTGDAPASDGEPPGLELVDRVDETERRSVRKEADGIVGGGHAGLHTTRRRADLRLRPVYSAATRSQLTQGTTV